MIVYLLPCTNIILLHIVSYIKPPFQIAKACRFEIIKILQLVLEFLRKLCLNTNTYMSVHLCPPQ